MTITHITREARVSRRVFYANFESKEQCFLAAFDVVVGHIRELGAEAVAPIADWPSRAIAARPEATGDPRHDAYLGALVEHLAAEE